MFLIEFLFIDRVFCQTYVDLLPGLIFHRDLSIPSYVCFCTVFHFIAGTAHGYCSQSWVRFYSGQTNNATIGAVGL